MTRAARLLANAAAMICRAVDGVIERHGWRGTVRTVAATPAQKLA